MTAIKKQATPKKNVVIKTCKMCKKEFPVAEYYLRLHKDRKFCCNECFKRYRTYKGLIQASMKNPERKMKIDIRDFI